LEEVLSEDKETVTVQVTYNGIGWVGFSFSEGRSMLNQIAVIGLPGEPNSQTNPGKYLLASKAGKSLNTLLSAEEQTLENASISQNDTHTVLKFTQRVAELENVPISATNPGFALWAYGTSNEFGKHAEKGSLELQLTPCGEDPEGDDPGQPENQGNDPQAECAFQDVIDIREDGSVLIEEFVDLVDQSVSVRMTYSDQGWLGFSFSAGTSMLGSIAVIGFADQPLSQTNPGKYSLNSKNSANANTLLPLDQQTLTNATITQNDTHTVMQFTKKLEEDNEVPISVSALNNALYAVGRSNTFAEHLTRGSFQIQLTPCGQEGGEFLAGNSGIPDQGYWLSHGLLMSVAWAIMIPLGIGSSMLRDLVPLSPKGWFYLHAGLNMTAVFCVIAGFSMAVHKVGESKGPEKHFSQSPHHKVGLAVFLFAVLQALNGLFRPHAPHAPPKEEKQEEELDQDVEDGEVAAEESLIAPVTSKIRAFWEYFHRIFGVSALGMAWYNIYSGFDIYSLRFGEKNPSTAFLAVGGGLAGTIIVVYAFLKLKKWRSSAK